MLFRLTFRNIYYNTILKVVCHVERSETSLFQYIFPHYISFTTLRMTNIDS